MYQDRIDLITKELERHWLHWVNETPYSTEDCERLATFVLARLDGVPQRIVDIEKREADELANKDDTN